MIAKADQVIRRSVQATGEWQPGLANYLSALLPPEPRVVIGGGHVGLTAFQLWRALSVNVLSWGESPVHVIPIALGSKTELLQLAQNPFNTGDNRLWDAIPGDLHAGGGDPERWPRQTVVAAALDDVWDDARLDLIFLGHPGVGARHPQGCRTTPEKVSAIGPVRVVATSSRR